MTLTMPSTLSSRAEARDSSQDIAGPSGIQLDRVSVSYRGTEVLKPLTLTIAPGEVLALIGPSGSGKTTVLRAIAGFVQPSAGRIAIGDVDVTDVPPYERGLGMVVQNYALFPHMRVEDNVAFGLRAQGKPRGLTAERVEEALAIVGMSAYAKRYPSQLSGGQQQRVAIARAIAVRPKVLLLDEPLSALDAQIRHSMVEEIARLHRELPDLTILYVTHDQGEALTLADKIGIMRDGHRQLRRQSDRLLHLRRTTRLRQTAVYSAAAYCARCRRPAQQLPHRYAARYSLAGGIDAPAVRRARPSAARGHHPPQPDAADRRARAALFRPRRRGTDRGLT